MKKNIIALVAIVATIGCFAFSKATTQNEYWFKFNGSTFVWDRLDATPSVSCTPSGLNDCARGYDAQPTSDGMGGFIYPGTTPDVELLKQ